MVESCNSKPKEIERFVEQLGEEVRKFEVGAQMSLTGPIAGVERLGISVITDIASNQMCDYLPGHSRALVSYFCYSSTSQ